MRVLLDEMKQIKSGRRELRQFAWLFGAVLLSFAAFAWFKDSPTLPWWVAGASYFLLSGLLLPILLKPLHMLWMGLAVVLGLVVSHVLLSVLFFVLFGLMGLFLRLAGKDLLNRFQLRKSPPTYWNSRSPNTDPKRYEQQF